MEKSQTNATNRQGKCYIWEFIGIPFVLGFIEDVENSLDYKPWLWKVPPSLWSRPLKAALQACGGKFDPAICSHFSTKQAHHRILTKSIGKTWGLSAGPAEAETRRRGRTRRTVRNILLVASQRKVANIAIVWWDIKAGGAWQVVVSAEAIRGS